MFYLRGIIEQVGRGTLKIVNDCQAAGLRSPEWKEVPSGIKLVFHGRHRKIQLNRRQRELIARLQAGDRLRPSDYYGETEGVVSERQSRRDLTGLEKGGLAASGGPRPGHRVREDGPASAVNPDTIRTNRGTRPSARVCRAHNHKSLAEHV